jgi:hypothetical protein
LDAADAAFFVVTLPDEVCDSALPAAVLDAAPVELLFRTVEAFFATAGLVDLDDFLATFASLLLTPVTLPAARC